ncbi:hypothetical protein WOLCODRAFT_116887 [Wolfiporia cocos MD-104 SS10]|uniref:Cation/H+ exchanger transmembrane domain-containing protein n=1 Tax=Wolfiporia cocos (strain MD-104) TaxID=742152 RepID=A0A2H3JD84_WOLCO|nr:hypothetical protein WOLCODRAFT_116887 [Wolfiporia cocos MD-104 SS10]
MSRFKMFSVTAPHVIYAALGGFVVLFGMFSLFIRERLYIGEACWAFLFGVIIGPYGANIFNPRDWGGGNEETTNTIVLEFTRVVLAIGVFAIGVELPKAYMKKHWRSLFFLLFPVMTWGWFVSAGLIYALIPGLNFLSALAVAACLTPTDPILAAAVVGGKYADKHVPAHIRHLLAAESGCNDGAAFPFLFIALYLTIDPSTGRAISDWFLLLWLYQVILGIVFGSILGYGFRHLMKFCEKHDLIDRQSYVAQYISLAMLTIGANTLLGADDLLAAFSCGTAFAWDGFFNKQTEESVFSSVIDLLFNIAAFVFVGAWMPFDDFSDTELTLSAWRLIVIAILVLLLRRLPVMVALYKWIPDVKTIREAFFSGHFGPMGIGAIFISTLAAQQLPRPESPPASQAQLLAATIQPICAFMVLCSITIHGLSIPFFSLGRRVHTVSRTWSRHDTWGRPAPEWMSHTQRIVPGEEIIINRDSEMERGMLSPHEKLRRGDQDSSTLQDEKEEGSSSRSQDESAMRQDGTDMREQNIPDGGEVVQEWQEGPHRIIERRAGPGEEVEVEVQENAFGPNATTVGTIRVAEQAVEQVADDITTRIRHAPEELEVAVDEAESNLRRGAEEVEDKTKQVMHKAQQKAKQAVGMQDEDEGWLSDASNGGRQVSKSTSPDGRKRSKRPFKSPPVRPSQGSARRRSMRRVLHTRSFRPHHEDDALPQHEEEDSSQEDHGYEAGTESPRERRGRHSVHGSSSSGPPTPRSPRPGPRHARINSLISIDHRYRGSRDHSPARSARSVRFADEPSSPATPGTPGTPRGLMSPSSPTTPVAGSEVPSETEDITDSPRNQVRFSLPDMSERR